MKWINRNGHKKCCKKRNFLKQIDILPFFGLYSKKKKKKFFFVLLYLFLSLAPCFISFFLTLFKSDKAGADLQCNNPKHKYSSRYNKTCLTYEMKKEIQWSSQGACLGLYASLIHIIIMFISVHYPCNI